MSSSAGYQTLRVLRGSCKTSRSAVAPRETRLITAHASQRLHSGTRMTRNRRFSPTVRLLRATTALVTVWCLGCGAIDPLFAGLGSSGEMMMMCASEGDAPAAGDHTTSAAAFATHGAAVTAASIVARNCDACGCQSCYAPQTTLAKLPPATPSAPRAEDIEATPPVSLARAPLLPPPERIV